MSYYYETFEQKQRRIEAFLREGRENVRIHLEYENGHITKEERDRRLDGMRRPIVPNPPAESRSTQIHPRPSDHLVGSDGQVYRYNRQTGEYDPATQDQTLGGQPVRGNPPSSGGVSPLQPVQDSLGRTVMGSDGRPLYRDPSPGRPPLPPSPASSYMLNLPPT